MHCHAVLEEEVPGTDEDIYLTGRAPPDPGRSAWKRTPGAREMRVNLRYSASPILHVCFCPDFFKNIIVFKETSELN